MLSLLYHFREHFDDQLDQFASFTKHGVQCEGWFKAEMLSLLDSMEAQGVIDEFDREVRCQSGIIDLRLNHNGQHWIELKHWLIGRQRGTNYGCGFYFRDNSSVGITPDCRKLITCPNDSNRWLLILATSNPGQEPWDKGVADFNNKFSPLHVRSYTQPGEFPASYFLGLLAVSHCEDPRTS